MNIYAYIVYKRDGKKMVFMLNKDEKIFKIINSQNIKNSVEIRVDDRIFLPYIIKGKGIDRANSFEIIFLQDITHWKHTLQKAIIQTVLALLVLVFITAMIISYGFESF